MHTYKHMCMIVSEVFLRNVDGAIQIHMIQVCIKLVDNQHTNRRVNCQPDTRTVQSIFRVIRLVVYWITVLRDRREAVNICYFKWEDWILVMQ